MTSPIHLRCEYQNNPLGVETPVPRLSWQLHSDENGVQQTAYRIVVAGCWDTGKVDSSSSAQIEYEGTPLVSCKQYRWRVQIWDQQGQLSEWSDDASFTMAVISPQEWSAQWICHPGNQAEGSASELAGASWIWASKKGFDPLRPPLGSFHFSREFSIPEGVNVVDAQFICAADSRAVFSLNGQPLTEVSTWNRGKRISAKEALRSGTNQLKVAAFNEGDTEQPAGFVCSLQIKLQGGETIDVLSDKEWSLIQDKQDEPETQLVELALWGEGPWGTHAYIDTEETQRGLPIYKKSFTVRDKLTTALVNVSGLGQYQLFINGLAVSDTILNPPWSVYEKTTYFNTFDISSYLNVGENDFLIMVGKGFYNTLGDERAHHVNNWGELMVILEARLTYHDGATQTFITDKSWGSAYGPYYRDTILSGCDYDACAREPEAWVQPIEIQNQSTLRAIESPPMKCFEKLSPVKPAEEPEAGIFVYDFGENLSAIPRVVVRGRRGQTIRMTPAEQRHEQTDRCNNGTGRVNQAGVGSPNYFEYTLGGDEEETWQPPFTYGGFQYLELTGAVPTGAPNPMNLPVIEAITSVHVRSSTPAAGAFSCSNSLWCKIDQAIDRAVRSNLAHVVTDCPTREKMGWLEVPYLMGPSISRRYDVSRLYAKVMRDIRESQGENGAIYTTAPRYANFDEATRIGYTIEWGAAGVILPWQLYRWYGDRHVLKQSYASMKAFVDHITGSCINLIPPGGLGDWFDFGHGQPRGASKFTPPELTAMATYYRCTKVFAETAEILGHGEDARKYATLAVDIKATYNTTFYKGAGEYQHNGSPQTANSISLVTGLCNPAEEESVLQAIVKDLSERDYQQTAGDVGFHYLVEALSRHGCHDVICKLLNRREQGSYGFMLDRGWSALPEAWEAATNESMNHCMLGHIQQWFYQCVLGINQSEDSIAFEKITIQPAFETGLEWAEGHYDSIRGKIVSKWRRRGKEIHLELSIPPNTTATVHLPVDSIEGLRVNNEPLESARLIEYKGNDKTGIVLGIQSGRYKITAGLRQ